MAKDTTSSPGTSSSAFDLSEIREIVDLMAKNDITSFQLERDNASLNLRRGHDIDALKELLTVLPMGGGNTHSVSYPQAQQQYAPQQYAPQTFAPAGSPAAAPTAAPEAVGPSITSPMVGTFYRSSAPGEKLFVNVGDSVDENTVVCIIEAMKVMNEIKAEARGTIARIIAEDGKPVQYGQPLFQLV
jgi:acetyl-CoA carboxylase biotin carboxyl carrier protein